MTSMVTGIGAIDERGAPERKRRENSRSFTFFSARFEGKKKLVENCSSKKFQPPFFFPFYKTPTSFAASLNTPTASSTISPVCAALSCTRTRAFPFGTTG